MQVKYLLLLVLISCATQKPKQVTEIIFPVNDPFDSSLVFYENESTLESIAKAIKVANCVTLDPRFHDDIIKNGKYEHFNGDNKEISTKLLSDKKAIVGTYYKRFTKAIAYRNPGTDKIWFNRKYTKTSSGSSKLNTMIHERLHVLGFGHKGNSKNKYNNIESVPYKVGKLAQTYYNDCK